MNFTTETITGRTIFAQTTLETTSVIMDVMTTTKRRSTGLGISDNSTNSFPIQSERPEYKH